MTPISATIVTSNEERHIARAIRSLGCAEEVVVVDSGSTDQTCRIAESLGARVLQHSWEGFAAQKNFAAQQARYDWILSLDADEELDAEAQQAIREWKSSRPAASGYRFCRRALYCGRWIRHSGWYPDEKIRLYDRKSAEWQGAYVHESVVARGAVLRMRGEIRHYTCDSFEEHRLRIEFYTDLAARELLHQKARVGLARRFAAPAWVFLRTYFLQLGFLDGRQGFWIARMAARFVRRKYQKWQALAQKDNALT